MPLDGKCEARLVELGLCAKADSQNGPRDVPLTRAACAWDGLQGQLDLTPPVPAGCGDIVENRAMHSPRNESPRVGTASLRARVASANDTAEFANVPAWLDQPPNSEVKPPVSSRHQALPIGELTWENFERLSVRLVRTESDVEHCQLYGDRGAEQHGIDLYARQKDGQGYSVYQCRRVRRFTAAALRAAVQRFLEGAWSGRANRLVVFTTVSAVSAGLAAELERQAVKLKP